MPERICISGTGTEVGKTWVAARIAETLKHLGLSVSARKPVQSFDPADGITDAEVLAAATGEPVDLVCPKHRWYELPLAPPMAAEALGRPPFSLADLVAETQLPLEGPCLIEGVGGPRSPLADDGDTVDLAIALGAGRVVLVADPGLGAINSVVLSIQAFGELVVHVFLNRYDDASEIHRRNREWLSRASGLQVTTQVDQLVRSLMEVR